MRTSTFWFQYAAPRPNTRGWGYAGKHSLCIGGTAKPASNQHARTASPTIEATTGNTPTGESNASKSAAWSPPAWEAGTG